MRFGPLVVMVMGLSLMTAPLYAQTKEKGETQTETPIQLSQVPEPAMSAARQALGTTPTGASQLAGTQNGQKVYEVESKTAKGETAVHVTADGKILKREQGAD